MDKEKSKVNRGVYKIINTFDEMFDEINQTLGKV